MVGAFRENRISGKLALHSICSGLESYGSQSGYRQPLPFKTSFNRNIAAHVALRSACLESDDSLYVPSIVYQERATGESGSGHR